MIKDLSGYSIVVDLPVQWSEMDYFRHVNNAIYFKYFEFARIAYLQKMNYQKIMKESSISIIIASIEAKFITPLFYPDTIQIGTTISSLQSDRFIMDYAIFSTAQRRIAATGSSVVVTYDYKLNKKVGIPDNIRQLIKDIEGK